MLSAVLSLAASLGVAAPGALASVPDSFPLNDPRPRARHQLAAPSAVGMSATGLIRAEDVIYSDLQRGAFPGAALAVGRRGDIVLEEGFGNTGRGWDSAPVDPDETVYDLASLTKVVGTTTAVMLLVEDGKMRLDDRVSSYLPEFAGGGKEHVTIRHLLTHTAGLPAGTSVPSGLSRVEALAHVLRTPLVSYPGGRMEYSDISAVVLFAAAERAAGEPVYHLLDRRVFGPLGMNSTSYVFGEEGCTRCAGTSRTMGPAFRGKVHDPIARRLGGIAGNAGLFSTAHDMARFAAMLASGGQLDGTRIFRESTVRQFTLRQPGAGTRALGWDTPPPGGGGAAGTRISTIAYGHTGYTGTSLWIDPERGTWVVLLTNRTYDGEDGNRMQALRRAVHDRVAEATDRGYGANMAASGN
jgi:CubicO group peptidase (beta-lactamase class C family)